MENCKVIAVTNQKGGVGKTTTTVNLGVGLANDGYKVLLIDADPQGSLTVSLGIKAPDELDVLLASVLDGLINDEPIDSYAGIISHDEGVDLLPSNIELSAMETKLFNTMSREYVLRNYIDTVRQDYDYILIDCMPSLGMMTINALVAADSVIIPSQPNFLSTKGLNLLLHSISKVKRSISFTITGEGVNESVKTNSKVEITVDNLKPGTYTVTEQGYDKYEPQETRRVTVLAGQTATVSFNNVLRRGDLVVTKTSEDGLVEGVKFHLFGTSLSGIEVNGFAVTGKDGTAHFDDVLIGTGYTIEEIDTAVRYVVPANQTAAIEWNSVTNKSFSNVLKKFNVTVTKSDIENGNPNVMNEFYARDISRKVRSAHATRGKAGEPLCQPPYGYMKDPQNRKRWIIDPDAAPIVKEIFKLYIDGNGIDTIARIMQEEGHLNCTSYWASKGINRGGKKEQPNPYKWKSTSVYNILKRQEYCGDVLNFKTHSKSFKNHRRIDNPKEDWLIFEDVHDPIIDRNTYNKVQKMLANTKHRAPKEENGPKSIFCDLLYCADCHKKMWYHTNTVNKDIHYFSCSNYVKDYRGTCLTRHYIRADSIATIVEMELRRLADYLVDDTERFAEILAKKSTKEWESEKKAAQGELTKAEMRIEMIPKLLKKLYEDNLSGKTSDDDYSILSQEYSVERDQLKKKILGLRDKLKGMEDRAGEREAFVKAIRKFMSMKTLTAPLLRELIDHIDVYEVEGQGKNKTQRVVIYYKFVGYLEIPNDLSRPTYSADLREGVSVEYITCEAGEDILDDEPEADK